MRALAGVLVVAACGGSGSSGDGSSGDGSGTDGSEASSADVSSGSESSGGVPSLPCELPSTEGWTVERVAEAAHWSTGLSGTEWTIAARDGVRGIVYRSENRLVYAQHNGMQWISEDVAGIGIEQFIHPPALALDEGGQPIIGLGQKDPFGSTAIERRVAGAWQEEEVHEEPSDVGVAIGPDGAVSVITTLFYELEVWRNDGTAWIAETVAGLDANSDGVTSASIEIDDAGTHHVSYLSFLNNVGTLWVATSSPEGWQLERVAEPAMGERTDIAVAGDGTRFIAFGQSDETVAVAAAAPGGAWESTSIGNAPALIFGLFVDDAGEVSLAWFEQPDEDAPGSWHVSDPDGGNEQVWVGQGGVPWFDGELLHVVYLVQNGYPMWDVCTASHAR